VVAHGGPDFDQQYLLPDLDRLARSSRLVYYDQRGRGRSYSGETADDITVAGEIADLDDVRRSVGAERVTMLGHSWGCVVAMEYAVTHPDRISHLVLMNTAPATPADAAFTRQHVASLRSADQAAAMKALAADQRYLAGDVAADLAYHRIHFAAALQRRELLDELLARLRRGATAEGIIAARAIEHGLYAQTWLRDDYDLLDRLTELRVPTLLLHGDHDLIPVECAQHIAEAIPGARLDVLGACGHFAFLDQPDLTFDGIENFVASA